MRNWVCVALLVLVRFSGLSKCAFAEDSGALVRPTEDSIFGTQAPAETKKPTPSTPSGTLRDAFASGEVRENPLQIGGTYYQQMIGSAQSGQGLGSTPITAPLQLDGYLDGRPNDRVRAFVDARLLYDPTRDQYSNTTGGSSFASQSLQTQSTGASSLSTNQVPNNPQVVLDQVWLKFDIDRTIFVTAGKQHVKWGTSRFWNPTDFLNTQKRNPLLPYDLRLGNAMIKFDLPLESRKANLSAIALLDNPAPASTLAQLGGALRGETLLGNTEVGVDAVIRGGRTPVYGADISSPLGPFDVYAEASCLSGGRSQLAPVTLSAGQEVSTAFAGVNSFTGPTYQISGGINHDFAWKENRQATLGIEYFYNENGYTNSASYTGLIFTGDYQPFYLGRNYAAVYLTAEGPDADKHTSYTFSTLGNLSDKSFISRVDFTWRVLTYLTFESYVDYHYGERGGEFNFTLSTPQVTDNGVPVSAISVPATFFDVGLSLRVSI